MLVALGNTWLDSHCRYSPNLPFCVGVTLQSCNQLFIRKDSSSCSSIWKMIVICIESERRSKKLLFWSHLSLLLNYSQGLLRLWICLEEIRKTIWNFEFNLPPKVYQIGFRHFSFWRSSPFFIFGRKVAMYGISPPSSLSLVVWCFNLEFSLLHRKGCRCISLKPAFH